MASNQYIDAQLGALGDIPLVAEMNGDCATDLAVFQPGDGINRNNPTDEQAYWRWCPTDVANPPDT